MRYNRPMMSVLAVAISTTAMAEELPSREEMWRMIQQQQKQIQTLQNQVTENRQQADTTAEQLEATAQAVEEGIGGSSWTDRTSIGGYGELHYSNLDSKKEVDFHRFVLFFNHEFNDEIRLFTEFEVEHALAGEGKSGEVELEQAYIEFDLNDSLTAKGGLFLVPVGILNETHEPPTFYGVERNDVENIIIPSTWWEAGAGLNGRWSNGFSWDLAVHSGLEVPASGSSAFSVRSGRQKVSNAVAEDLAFTGRLKFTGIPGLELAGTAHYQTDADQMGDDLVDDGLLLSAHAIWNKGPFSVRGLWARWDFGGDAIEDAGGDIQDGWYIEPSYKILPSFGVYTRYEDVDGFREQDRFQQWEVGFNYWPHEDVVIKFDYRDRKNDVTSSRDDDGFDIGIGYLF